ncbi:MAG: hypothetical protein AB7I27_02455 [Bacteriovoracaceae bacterium]
MNLILALFLSGTFSGIGQANFASGRKYQCSKIFLNIKIKEDAFYLNEGGYSCGGGLDASFDNFKMTIQDGKLFNKTKQLGTISNEGLEYQIYDPADDSTYHLKLKKISTNSISYNEEWTVGGKIALTVNGELKRN